MTHTIRDVVTEVTPDTLLIFDIDNTIYRHAQILGSDEWFFDHLQDLIGTGIPKEEALNSTLDIFNAVEMVTKVVPVENCVIDVIKQMQEKKITCMAMTTRNSFLAHATMRQLSSIGINMNASPPTNASFRLTAIPQTEFRQGILYTDGGKKGVSLKEFLRQIQYRPKRVVFIDDKKAHLEDLSFLENEGIAYIGFLYENENQFGKSYDKKIAAQQLKMFCEIISDNAIRAMNEHNAQLVE